MLAAIDGVERVHFSKHGSLVVFGCYVWCYLAGLVGRRNHLAGLIGSNLGDLVNFGCNLLVVARRSLCGLGVRHGVQVVGYFDRYGGGWCLGGLGDARQGLCDCVHVESEARGHLAEHVD